MSLYRLTKENFFQVCDKKKIVYSGEVPEYVREYFELNGAELIESDTHEAITPIGTLTDWPDKSFCVTEVEIDREDYDFVHYIGNTTPNIKYRRNYLNEWLNEHFKVKTYRLGDSWNLKNDPKYGIIVSAPQGSGFLDRGLPVFYDRTDYWCAEERYFGMEDWLLKKAKIITCSSRFIAEHTPNGIRIDNGAEYFHYNGNKEDIAVYIGKEDNKVDDEVCKRWQKEHPELRFVSIGRKIPGFEFKSLRSHDEMMKFVKKCKVGLIPLKVNDYTRGQFNLKYWDYKQADLEVWTTIDYNYKDAKLTYWPEVCSAIIKAYGFPIPERKQHVIKIHNPDEVVYAKWRTSLACNFKCPYCIQRNSKAIHITRDEMANVAHEWARLIDRFYSKHNQQLKIGLIGGEPSIYPLDKYLKEWNSVAKKHNRRLSVDILTNFFLHNSDWWNSLAMSNIHLNLNTSLHPSQFKDDEAIKAHLDKAAKFAAAAKGAIITIKLVCGNDNFDDCLKYSRMIKERGLRLLVDGEREPKEQNIIVNDEAYKWSIDHGVKSCNLDGVPLSRTELIKKCHETGIHDCHCWHRIYIDGNRLITGCKLNKIHGKTIYDLDDLCWVEDDCRLFSSCSYCNAGKVETSPSITETAILSQD